MSEDFLLKWNDHHSLFCAGAEELCEREEHTDVTLTAGTKFFKAHRLVLSICSPYFRQLFRHLGKDKAVIFLKDVDQEHLDLLLQYMYKGEIKVKENDLVNVLNTAQALQIKGLSENNTTNSEPKTPELFARSEPGKREAVITDFTPHTSSKRQIPQPNSDKVRNVVPSNIQVTSTAYTSPPPMHQPSQTKIVPVKQELVPETIDLDSEHQQVVGVGVRDYEGSGVVVQQEMMNNEGDYQEEDYYDGGIGSQECHQDLEGCEQNVKTSNSGALHCTYCGKEYPSISTLRRHMPVHTGEKKFECENCTQRFTQSSSLYKHLKKANCVK